MMLAAWEIHATDPQASARFYAGPLGWIVRDAEWDGIAYLIVETPEGQPVGRIIKRHGNGPDKGAPVMGGVLTFAVDDIDAVMAAFDEHDAVQAMPKFDLPGEGVAAYYLDPDSNVFGLFEASR